MVPVPHMEQGWPKLTTSWSEVGLLGASSVPPRCLLGAASHPLTWSQVPPRCVLGASSVPPRCRLAPIDLVPGSILDLQVRNLSLPRSVLDPKVRDLSHLGTNLNQRRANLSHFGTSFNGSCHNLVPKAPETNTKL